MFCCPSLSLSFSFFSGANTQWFCPGPADSPPPPPVYVNEFITGKLASVAADERAVGAAAAAVKRSVQMENAITRGRENEGEGELEHQLQLQTVGYLTASVFQMLYRVNCVVEWWQPDCSAMSFLPSKNFLGSVRQAGSPGKLNCIICAFLCKLSAEEKSSTMTGLLIVSTWRRM